MSKKIYEYDFYGKKIVVEHGELLNKQQVQS